MKNILVEAIDNLGYEVVEEYVKNDIALFEKEESKKARTLWSANLNRLAVAACAVLVLGLGVLIPRITPPNIEDPTVPPTVSGSDNGTYDQSAPPSDDDPPISSGTGTDGNKIPIESSTNRPIGGDPMSPWAIAYEGEKEYELSNEYIELKIYYGCDVDDYHFYNDAVTHISVYVSYRETIRDDAKEKIIIKNLSVSEFAGDDKYMLVHPEGYSNEKVMPFRFNHFETVKIPTRMFTGEGVICIGLMESKWDGINDPEKIFNLPSVYLEYKIAEGKIVFEKTAKFDGLSTVWYYCENFE